MKNNWRPFYQSEPNTFIEVRFRDPFFVSSFEIFETYKAGALANIYVADVYREDGTTAW